MKDMNLDRKAVAAQADYPWISFTADLKDSGVETWMLLGEAVSKCIQVSLSPLKPETQRRVHEVYLAKGIQGTAAIEGNTLSEEEVVALMAGRKPKAPSKEQQTREIENLIRLLNEVGHAASDAPSLTVERLKWFNRRILDGLELEEDVVPGEYKSFVNHVGPYLAPKPDACPGLLERMCEWLSKPVLQEGFLHRKASDAILRALLAHLYIAWIHPFGDGNGRTARMIEFEILIHGGIPTPAAHLLSNHYNRTRPEYYRRLNEASKLPNRATGLENFIRYALQGFVDGLSEVLSVIRGQGVEALWKQHIYETLRHLEGNPGKRMRRLAWDFPMTLESRPYSLDEVAVLTPEVARAYAKVSQRTLRRDLAELEAHALIKRNGDKFCSNWRSTLNYLPRGEMVSTEEIAFLLPGSAGLVAKGT